MLIEDVAVLDDSGRPITRVTFLQTVRICLKARSLNGRYIGHIGIGIEKMDGEMVFVATTKNSGQTTGLLQ